MNSESSQSILISTIRHALLVMMICYLPQMTTTPWWILFIILSALGYRILADYRSFPQLNLWIRIGVALICLFLLIIQYGSIINSNFFISFLLLFVGLKSIEVRSKRDLKVLVLCNFYLIFAALIVIQELWIIPYLLIAILANLSLMLRLAAPIASLRQISNKSTKLLLIAIPMSILLFYIFPRLTSPLWQVTSFSQNSVGFNDKMSPGSIAELFRDDSTAMRITFKNKPVVNGYWRGVVLSFFDGQSWSPISANSANFPPLPELVPNEKADYEIILEPHQKKWLFYLGYPSAGRPQLLFSPNNGLITQQLESINQRFAYAFNVQSYSVQHLSGKEYSENTQLPQNINPRVTIWAKEQFANVHQDPHFFILFLENHIKQQPFWYTLTPPIQDTNRNSIDQFWFDKQKGFCEHYASAVTYILRTVGVPARVLVGYQGGEWNPIAQYLNIQHNDAHAWLEYWQDGVGWQEFDPTSFIAPERIDKRILDIATDRLSLETSYNTEGLSLLQKSRLFLSSARFFAERWLLYYNYDAQRNLLEKIGFGEWGFGQLLQASVVIMILFIILIGLYYWLQKESSNPLLIEYHLLQKEFRRFNVRTPPSATLNQQCKSLSKKEPGLDSILSLFLHRYEQLRLKPSSKYTKENKRETLMLFKTLRRKLSRRKPSSYNHEIATGKVKNGFR